MILAKIKDGDIREHFSCDGKSYTLTKTEFAEIPEKLYEQIKGKTSYEFSLKKKATVKVTKEVEVPKKKWGFKK